MNKGFNAYERHYARMNNFEPDWELAERNPKQHACVQACIPKNKDARILDFGCGWEHQLLGLWCAGYTNIEGVELVTEQAAVANRCARGKLSIACMDGREGVSCRQRQRL